LIYLLKEIYQGGSAPLPSLQQPPLDPTCFLLGSNLENGRKEGIYECDNFCSIFSTADLDGILQENFNEMLVYLKQATNKGRVIARSRVRNENKKTRIVLFLSNKYPLRCF
jgi:hypothetical protein